MAENKRTNDVESDEAESTAVLRETDTQFASDDIASDDPVDPMDEPGKPVPPRPPGTES